MTNCNLTPFSFSPLSGKKIEASFSGGSITSNAGVLLLREIDRQLGLTRALSKVISDPRDPNHIQHSTLSMLRQRIYSIACGYEDLNDQDQLRFDACFKTAVGKNHDLASRSTLSRFENGSTRADCVAVSSMIVEQFIAQKKKAPKELVLDFDPTDDAIHGNQEGKHYHGYYEQYCFLPLYVFCEDQLLVSYLRPSDIDGAKHAWAILSLLVKRFRQAWPEVKITFRGDGGLCRDKMLNWCHKQGVDYVVGMAKNNRLMKAVQPDVQKAKAAYESKQTIQRRFVQFEYAAQSWKAKRIMVARIQVDEHGESVRFIATSIKGQAKTLYEKRYCARGHMENMIKQQKLDLFSDRTSCHGFLANQMRVLLSGLAYVLLNALQRKTLTRSKRFRRAYVGTLRNAFLKVGAVIITNTRRVVLKLDSHYPHQDLFIKLTHKLTGT
ncbi:MAG: IS1380 family transposase [Candidatus Latescibacteria bacterium]|jgi:hypothetical protein|nr:IS1380 family transposase [Candidatus Latescibacterota bacterium]